MDSNWASEHLQVIRTLMERSAVYRRALAPIMLLAGTIGLMAAVIPCFVHVESNRAFASFWSAAGVITVIASFALARRQALKEDEAFWSPPTRRVTQALAPPFLAGISVALLFIVGGDRLPRATWLLSAGWIVLYGCALHAAGFFMLRGIKLFGGALAIIGSALLIMASLWPRLQTSEAAHYIMGGAFGVLHLGYGAYLHFTERPTRA